MHLIVLCWSQQIREHGTADPIVLKCSPGGQQGVDSPGPKATEGRWRPKATGVVALEPRHPSRSVAVISPRFLLPPAPSDCARSSSSHTTSLPSRAGSQHTVLRAGSLVAPSAVLAAISSTSTLAADAWLCCPGPSVCQLSDSKYGGCVTDDWGYGETSMDASP